jgi:cytochrome c oxidase subunit 3
MFIFSHQSLDVKWGFINTLILLFSSFTMAWAVRAAQLGQKKLLVPLLAITILCGFGFLGVKAIEYTAKFEHGTTWGKTFHVTREALEEHLDEETYAELAAEGKLPKEEGEPASHDSKGAGVGSAGALGATADTMSNVPSTPSGIGGTMPPGPATPLTTGSAREAGTAAEPSAGETQAGQGTSPASSMPADAKAPAASTPPGGAAAVVVREGPGLVATSAVPVPPAGTPSTYIPRDASGNLLLEHSQVAPASRGPLGLSYTPSAKRIGTHESSQPPPPPGHKKWHGEIPPNPQVFFSIYFMMTGLHGIHVVIGMICIFVVLLISARGGYGEDYMTPVDLVGLYWHLVDLIWIFLFPLLYLIH